MKSISLFCPTIYLDTVSGKLFTYPDKTILRHSNRGELFDLIRSQEAIHGMGGIYINELLNGLHFYKSDSVAADTNIDELVEQIKAELELRIFFLWLIRDNSCNAMQLIGIDKTNNTVYISRSNRFFCNAQGEYNDVSYTDDELILAFDNYQKFNQITNHTEKESELRPEFTIGSIRPSKFSFVKYNTLNRIGRAFSFLQAARLNSLLPAKISYYVLFLECLFSGDDMGEIQHKIALRISHYMESQSDKKKQLFDFVKLTYRVRSKYLHGQQLSKGTITREQLLPISADLDELIRNIFIKIMNDPAPFLQDSEDLRSWLDGQTF